MTIQQALELALQHHQSGRLEEAEEIYRQILAAEPSNADALHLLGVIAHQVGQNDAALDLIRQAIALRPNFPEAYTNLGGILNGKGQWAEAIAAYRQAIVLRPDYPEALTSLGVILKDKGHLDEAIAVCRQAVFLSAGFPKAHVNLGLALYDKRLLDEAIAAYRQAIVLMPNYPEAYTNLSNALRDKKQLDEAIAASCQAVALRADFPEAHVNLGAALYDKGQLDEAIAAFHEAIALKPNYSQAYSNLGNALRVKGQLDEAIAACRHAVFLSAGFPEAHGNLGVALYDKGQLGDAIASYREAITLKPGYPEAHSNLGAALKDMGQLDEAIAACRQAIALHPDLAVARSNFLLTLNYDPALDPVTVAGEHRRWNMQHAEPLRHLIEPHQNVRDSERRLRVGYVSPDFREHSVSYFLEGLLACHDPGQVEVFCYANVHQPDAVTSRMERLVPHWRQITGKSDEVVAAQIRGDGIDILVDLAGHTADNRLLIFASKPAPVQVSWLGYPNTTGLDAMDCRLSDAWADSPGSNEHLHSERLVRLPFSAWCYRPPKQSPAVEPRPALGGSITFGSFNAMSKINGPLLKLWSEILLALPDARLLLKNSALCEPSVQQRIRAEFDEAGIAPERIEMTGYVSGLADHLSSYGRVDIALDTYPYHGTTTTCETLWMGVPVVTLAGNVHASRVGVSLLHGVGLSELIALTPEDYVRIAVGLAGDPARLGGLRSTLRGRMEKSPLMDAPRFARDIEAAYREMWQRWCAGEAGGRS